MLASSKPIESKAATRDCLAEAARPHVVFWPLFTALFVVGWVLAGAMFTYVPFRFIEHALDSSTSEARVGLAVAGPILIAAVSLVTGIRWCALFAISFTTFRGLHRSHQPSVESWPLVSVFVPAYNESETIESALESLIDLDYPHFEVIVVDDGSKDDTYERARRFEGRYGSCDVQVHRKVNGGKWSAHNFAFQRSRGELILCLDADSRVERTALRRLVARMTDPSVCAVSGQIRVRNRINLLTLLQGLEYIMANGAMRMAQSASGTVLVVPGPIGLFRRTALEDVYLRYGRSARTLSPGEVLGPFEGDTFAEDFDLSLAILTLGGRVVYEPHAVSHTKAPDWAFALLNQRYRWARGTIQVLRKLLRRAAVRPEILHPRLLVWLVVTYGLELLIAPLAYLAGLGLVAAYLLAGFSLLPLLAWAGAFLAVHLLAAALFTLMHDDRLTVLCALPFYDLYHGFLLNSGWLIAVIDEIRGARMRW